MKDQTPTYSANSLQMYSDCARRYELTYLEGLVWPAVEQEPVLESERFLKNGRVFHEMVHRDLLGLPVLHPADPEIAGWWQRYQDVQPAAIEGRKFPEQTLAVSLEGHVLVATFDLIVITDAGKAIIFDWKTWRHPERVKEIDKKMQSRVYPYLLKESVGALVKDVTLAAEDIEMRYWLTERPDEPYVFAYSDEKYQADKDYLLAQIGEIESTPAGGFMLTEERGRCRYCSFRSYCERGDVAGHWDDADQEVSLDDSNSLVGDLDDYEMIAF